MLVRGTEKSLPLIICGRKMSICLLVDRLLPVQENFLLQFKNKPTLTKEEFLKVFDHYDRVGAHFKTFYSNFKAFVGLFDEIVVYFKDCVNYFRHHFIVFEETRNGFEIKCVFTKGLRLCFDARPPENDSFCCSNVFCLLTAGVVKI